VSEAVLHAVHDNKTQLYQLTEQRAKLSAGLTQRVGGAAADADALVRIEALGLFCFRRLSDAKCRCLSWSKSGPLLRVSRRLNSNPFRWVVSILLCDPSLSELASRRLFIGVAG
jgi:hypothetical protein